MNIMKEGKSPDRFKWEKIIFTDLKPETDVFIYRQMCEMLIPQKECTNRFRIKATGEMTDFYIGSNDLLSLRFMKSFFSRLYSLKYEEEKESVEEVKVFNLYRLTSYRIAVGYKPCSIIPENYGNPPCIGNSNKACQHILHFNTA